VEYQQNQILKEQENMKKDLTQHLAMVTYYGVPMPKCPATIEELRAGGSAIIEHSPYYIEDETPYNKFQKATLIVKDNHIQVIGPTGSGKDEWGRQMAAKTGRPIALFNFNDDGDQSGWVTRTTLEKEDGVTVTNEVEGSLRRACQGLTIYRRLKNVLPDVETDADVEELIAARMSTRSLSPSSSKSKTQTEQERSLSLSVRLVS
jgi:hypothetical protein